jgi:hypothetical protein
LAGGGAHGVTRPTQIVCEPDNPGNFNPFYLTAKTPAILSQQRSKLWFLPIPYFARASRNMLWTKWKGRNRIKIMGKMAPHTFTRL